MKNTVARIVVVSLSAGAVALGYQGAAFAQQPNWSAMPTVSPKPNDPNDPMALYYHSMQIGEWFPYWVYHIWYNPDGTTVLFYGHRYPDGTTRMGASERYWRLVGTPGDYHMCIKVTPDAPENCNNAPFELSKIGDILAQDYDREASGDIPKNYNVHEVFIFVDGKK